MKKQSSFGLEVPLSVLGFAIGIHILVFLFMHNSSAIPPMAVSPSKRNLISLIPSRPAVLTPLPLKPKSIEDLHPPGQVVQIPKPLEEKRPEQAKFLAEHDSTVKKETKKKGNSGGAPPVPPTQPQKKEVAQKKATHSLKKPQTAKKNDTQKGVQKNDAVPLIEGTGPKMAQGTPSDKPNIDSPSTEPGKENHSGTGEIIPPKKPNLFLTPSQASEILGFKPGQGGSPDHLEDVDEGDATGLNAKSWKYAGFFNRVKEAVRVRWHPDSAIMKQDPYGNVYGVKSRVTVLRVCLTPGGDICDLKVVRSSQVESLDEEALHAFREAQPFENPPRTLVGNDGRIHFTFGFIVEMSGRSHFQISRSSF